MSIPGTKLNEELGMRAGAQLAKARYRSSRRLRRLPETARDNFKTKMGMRDGAQLAKARYRRLTAGGRLSLNTKDKWG